MTRGRCGSLLHIRMTLSFTTPRRFQPAHKEMNEMKIHKTYIAIGMIIAFALFFELAAHASVADQATQITFSQPVQVPGQVLPAGTYLFKLVNTDSLDIVQIFNSDRTHLYATLETVPTE